MFTGIVQATGEIAQVDKIRINGQNSLCLGIFPGSLDVSDISIGDSIAVNGVCLTVTALLESTFTVDVSQETLSCTYGLNKINKRVNLEKALRLSDRLGGHLVSGHVDAVGEVTRLEASEPNGNNYLVTIRSPKHLLRYIACKGSITVNGVSLTVNRITQEEFCVNLIPHTLSNTTLNELKPGSQVNLEVDMLARYIERLSEYSRNLENENQYR
ncbi:riboflavin synthase alpha chain [Nitrosomonas marina]|uniref:Riboflavin synthase n=1 Tax=Nitrosomonas marina TaxID=917 RepID=A0A1I0FB55_9PROT|nr:riboflavin synthase [Nitrosomonas marina]SET54550.1 riboflavin synthase alpha chain [Nitrosomonas marina]